LKTTGPLPSLSGEPQLTLAWRDDPVNASRLLLALPTVTGPLLLAGDPTHPADAWAVHSLPGGGEARSVSLLDGYAIGRRYLEFAYIAHDQAYYSLSFDEGATWQQPAPLVCGHLKLQPNG